MIFQSFSVASTYNLATSTIRGNKLIASAVKDCEKFFCSA
jgi:hypothetical protein